MSNCIKEVENGPLILEADSPVLSKDGEDVVTESPAYLCRCGASQNKPFCDGAHQKKGFSSKTEISKELTFTYEGKELEVNFNRSICAGASACVKGLPSVFLEGGLENWIVPDNDTANNVINVINNCPSGALSYRLNNKLHIDERANPKINIIKNGPYNVEGIPCMHETRPTNASQTKYTLCRCGYSKNKPYCDYSHAQNNWTDD